MNNLTVIQALQIKQTAQEEINIILADIAKQLQPLVVQVEDADITLGQTSPRILLKLKSNF